jgi:PmbA protein
MELRENLEKAETLIRNRSIHDFEIFGISSDIIRAESKGLKLESLTRSNESGISLRVLIGGAMGFSYGSEASENLIDAAVTSARHQFKDDHNRIPSLREIPVKINGYDPEVASLGADECISRAIMLENAARETDPRVEKVRKAAFSRSSSQVQILNSQGIQAMFSLTSVSSSLMVMVRQDADVQSGYDFDFSHRLSGFDGEKVGRSAVERATALLGARQLKTTRIPVMFDPTSTAEMLEFISDGFLGENVMKGKSFLRDKRGAKCFSECISLSDNPLDARAADPCPFDGEGVASQHTVLVRDGSVEGFLYDTYWASAAGTGSTGNSVRGGYRSWPTLGTRHICLDPSCEPMSSSLAGLPRVLKVTDIMGMHTANPVTGELSVGISGIILEHGNPVYPVREAALSGNIYEMFTRVISVGDEAREFGHVLCGSLLVDAVDICSQ